MQAPKPQPIRSSKLIWPEVTELLLRRLGLVWTPEPESLEPCWKALLSGSPDFASCYERLVQPRQEVLACSPLAADALLLDAFYEDNMRSLPEEWESFLSNRQLALQRGLQGRWEEAVRLEPLPLLMVVLVILTASSLLAGSLMTWPTLSFRYWASLMLFSLLMAVWQLNQFRPSLLHTFSSVSPSLRVYSVVAYSSSA